VRILCIGAHPDDCEIKFAGAAIKFARAGHAVKFLSVTNGQSGHHLKFGDELIAIRRGEAQEAAKRLGIAESEVLHASDGTLQPDLASRAEIISQIRRWKADLVLTHRGCDYHPDHRYTSQLVQDAAYLVLVPAMCPDAPPLRVMPMFLYLEDEFRLPAPFRPDIAVRIDDVWCDKVYGMDAHASQFYEWLPWIDQQSDDVPTDPEARRQWLSVTRTRPISLAVGQALARRYPLEAAQEIHAEAFEVCEYGRQPSPAELDEIFPR
jgi:LmbE family N-acetylglucosaminyl deacetylase